MASTGYITLGPWGGPGGNDWSHKVNGGIKQIVIASGDVIDSIEFKSDDGNDLRVGGDGGSRTDTVDIDWPVEYLTNISGTYGSSGTAGQVVVRSLSFYTNRTTYGPYGKNEGTAFSIPMEGGVVVGFHGRAGQYLNAIGVHVKPAS